ncbi:MAG: hypothetical protein E7665_11220 [Ruminococcaceae bacterium]|nr:hypothetical protein [Oscillospiraceae bacterium]
MKKENIINVKTVEVWKTNCQKEKRNWKERIIYVLFKNELDTDKREIRTYGIMICKTGSDFKTECKIMCDVTCELSQARKIFEKVWESKIVPKQMAGFIVKELDEASELMIGK